MSAVDSGDMAALDRDDDPDEFEEYHDDDGGDELEESMQNCGKLPDGTCMKAGSEECDWECPFSGEDDE